MIARIQPEYQSDAGSIKDTYRASYEASFVNIFEEIDRVITAPHCIISMETKPCFTGIPHKLWWYSGSGLSGNLT